MKLRYIVIGFFAIVILHYTVVLTFGSYVKSSKGIKDTGHTYIITVDDRNNSATHISDSILSQTERCVEFRNEFGMIQTECGDRISKIQIK